MTGKVFKLEKIDQVRQGDVFLKPVDSVPEGCEPYNIDVVHRGEGTHTHRMEGEYKMFESKTVNPLTEEKDIYIIITPEDAERLKEEAMKQGTLTHEEHDHIILAPGTYLKRPQREFDAIATMQERIEESHISGIFDMSIMRHRRVID
jgi:hypothetical protein